MDTAVFAAVFLFLVLLGLLGNISVMAMALNNRSLPSVYLVNKAVADIITLCAIPVFLALGSHNEVFLPFGPQLCNLQTFFTNYGPFISQMFLLLLVIDCYLATRPQNHDLKYRWDMFKIASVFIWSFTALIIVNEFVGQKDSVSYCLTDPINNYHIILAGFSLISTLLVPAVVFWFNDTFFSNLDEAALVKHEEGSEDEGNTKIPKSTKYLEAGENQSIAEPLKSLKHLEAGEGEEMALSPKSLKPEDAGFKLPLKRLVIGLSIVIFVCQMPFWAMHLFNLLQSGNVIALVGRLVAMFFFFASFAINSVLYFCLGKKVSCGRHSIPAVTYERF